MADRVDRPGHVVQQEHPDEAAPQQRGQGRAEAAADDPAERKRHPKPSATHRPNSLSITLQGPVLDQVRREALAVGGADGLEQPSHMRVPQALDATPESGPAQVRGVRVALLVGEGVVLAVVGHPGDDRPCTAIDPRTAITARKVARGLERSVREHAVVAECDPEAGEHVQTDHAGRARAGRWRGSRAERWPRPHPPAAPARR